MTQLNDEGLIYSRKHSRSFFFNDCVRWVMIRQLLRQSRKHISEQRKQLVVFSFDFIAHNINLSGVYEKDDLDTFFEWTQSLGIDFKGATALDIGANIGNHSLYFAEHFKNVISFEPHPRIFKVLSLNAELADNIQCYNVGLSDTAGTASLSVAPANMGNSSLSGVVGSESVDVRVVKLDDFGTFENIKLLKIDVEGHEYRALCGARKVIDTHRPIILFEQHVDDFLGGESKVLSFLREAGYRYFGIIRKYPPPLPSLFKFAVTPFMRILVGEQTRILLKTSITPDFYSFVIALPDWVANVSGITRQVSRLDAGMDL